MKPDQEEHPALMNIIEAIGPLEGVDTRRLQRLDELVSYLADAVMNNGRADLVFVCTHNSRRSQLAQVWMSAIMWMYGIGDRIGSWSGGTEVTAFHPNAVSALARAGFSMEPSGGQNPRYRVTIPESNETLTCFSKRFDDPFNPSSGFAAVMVCSDADAACPIVPGAAFRLSLPFTDPGKWDGSNEESARYDSCSEQIAGELKHVAAKLVNLLS